MLSGVDNTCMVVCQLIRRSLPIGLGNQQPNNDTRLNMISKFLGRDDFAYLVVFRAIILKNGKRSRVDALWNYSQMHPNHVIILQCDMSQCLFKISFSVFWLRNHVYLCETVWNILILSYIYISAGCISGLILGLCPANNRRLYKVTPSLAGRKPRFSAVFDSNDYLIQYCVYKNFII